MVIKPPGQEIPSKHVPEGKKNHGKCSFKVAFPYLLMAMMSCTGIFATDSRWNGKWKAPGKLGIEGSKLHLVSCFQGKTPVELKATPEEPTCFNSTLREHAGTKISAGREWKARNFQAIPQIFEEELRRLLKEREKCQWTGQDDFQGSAGAQG